MNHFTETTTRVSAVLLTSSLLLAGIVNPVFGQSSKAAAGGNTGVPGRFGREATDAFEGRGFALEEM